MRRLLLILLATIPLTGCQFFNRDQNAALIEPIDPAVADVENGGGVAAAPDGTGTAEVFAEPTLESQPKANATANLIRSTDPAARTRQVERSRPDPFASLPIPPAPDPIVVPVAAASNTTPTRAVSSTSSGGSSGRSVSTASSDRVASKPTPPPVRVQPSSTTLVKPSPIAVLPTIPRPVIAPTISVSGVIQMGNEPYAILRSGNEPERYVRVGDRVAGGSVRVKRIETLAFEPRVILEENGIEVPRPVSANAASSSNSQEDDETAVTAPAATVPTLPSPFAQAARLSSALSSALPVPAAAADVVFSQQ